MFDRCLYVVRDVNAMREPDFFEDRGPVSQPVDNETAWLLGQGIRTMHLAEEQGDREYSHVIRLLRADAHAAATVADIWIEAARDDPLLRWSLLYLLAEIEDTACLDVLRRQAMRQLPERVGEEGGCEQASDYEELVAVMAIEGLGRLAKAGTSEAVDALMQVVGRQDRKALRQPAAAAVLAARMGLRERVAELLPEDERYVLDLREATEADFYLELAHEDRDRKPNRREARPKLPLVRRDTDAPGNHGGER
jgi:hypothetical protein